MNKRKGCDGDASRRKKVGGSPTKLPLHRDLLDLFYPNCICLRKYVLASLPQTSRLRRRKIESIGTNPERCALEKELSHLLDSTLVCYQQLTPDTADNRWEQWLSFSQKGEDSSVSLTAGSPIYSQSEVCVSHEVSLVLRLTCPDCRLCNLAALLTRQQWSFWTEASSLRWISPERHRKGRGRNDSRCFQSVSQ